MGELTMRVVWISVGLLAVFLVSLIVLDDPASTPDQEQLVASENNQIDNPFVEESAIQTDAANQIDLAVLPSSQSSNDNSPQPEFLPATANQVVSAEPDTAITKTTEQIAPDNSNAEKTSVDVVPVVEDVATSTEADQADEKKPGLAMIMLEKERNKNKLAVIVHESNSQNLTEKEIKALYLDRLTRWEDGSKVMLYDLPLGDRYRDKFSKAILKMTALEADKQELKRRELRIKANDVEVKAKNVVVSYVERDPNAVAYVPLSLVREQSNVKVVLTIP